MAKKNTSSQFIGFVLVFMAMVALVNGAFPVGIFLVFMYFMVTSFMKNKERVAGKGRPGVNNKRDPRSQSYRRKEEKRSSGGGLFSTKKANPYREAGMTKYKEYDYLACIEDFKKALAIDPRDVAVHWNIACAYSLTEQKEQSMVHLNKAVEYGFKDFKKIDEHDALAYLRIQDEFESFKKNGYRLSKGSVTEPSIMHDENLLAQLDKLAELKENGLLTEEQFAKEKRKLLP